MRPSLTLVVATAVVFCSGGVLGQLTCEPGAGSPLQAGCRPVGDSETLCKGDFTKCLVHCFDPLVNVDDSSKYSRGCLDDNSPLRSDMNITYKLVPMKYNYFNLTVQLPQLDSGKYVVELNVGFPVCACTNQTTHSFTVKYKDRDSMKLVVKSSPGGPDLDRSIPHPRHCADVERIPYDADTCGLPQLEKPTDIVFQCNETHTEISWNSTTGYITPGTDKYVPINSNMFYLTVNYSRTFVAVNTTSVTLNTTEEMTVSLYSYKQCSGLYKYSRKFTLPELGCSPPTTSTNRGPGICCGGNSNCQIMPSVSSVVPTQTSNPLPFEPEENDHTPSALTLTIVLPTVAVAFTALVVIVVFILIAYKLVICRPHSKQILPSPLQYSPLIIYSPNTPEQEKLVVMQSFAAVQNAFLQDTRRPQQSLVNWILEHYERANAVFCVCNREFKSDWETGAPSEDSSVAVQTLRLLFEGDLGSVELKKYAVVLSKPTDEEFIPPLLKSLPRINLSDTTTLVHFVA